MTNAYVFRPKTAVFMGVFVILLDALYLIQSIFYSSAGLTLGVAGLSTTVGAFAWLAFIHPKVEIFDEGVVVVNPFYTATVGWQSVDNIETKYSLTYETGSAKVSAWAAPAPSRYQSKNILPAELKGLDLDDIIRPSDSPRSYSGSAAYISKLRLKAFESAGNITGLTRGAKRNWLGILVVVSGAVSALVGFVAHI
jgi:hypothetical protein